MNALCRTKDMLSHRCSRTGTQVFSPPSVPTIEGARLELALWAMVWCGTGAFPSIDITRASSHAVCRALLPLASLSTVWRRARASASRLVTCPMAITGVTTLERVENCVCSKALLVLAALSGPFLLTVADATQTVAAAMARAEVVGVVPNTIDIDVRAPLVVACFLWPMLVSSHADVALSVHLVTVAVAAACCLLLWSVPHLPRARAHLEFTSLPKEPCIAGASLAIAILVDVDTPPMLLPRAHLLRLERADFASYWVLLVVKSSKQRAKLIQIFEVFCSD